MAPTADMTNHGDAGVCDFHFVSTELHSKPDPANGYYSHDKYLCDVRLVTGKSDDQATDKILKGTSIKNYPQKAAPGNVAIWEKEIKTKEIWELTYDDN